MKIFRSSPRFVAAGALFFAAPSWASYTEGFATFVVFYHAVVVVLVSYPIVLLLCFFKVFRHLAALVAHMSVLALGASFILFVAYHDARKEFMTAIILTLILFAIAIAPSAIQHLYFRRKRQKAYEESASDLTLSEILARDKASSGSSD